MDPVSPGQFYALKELKGCIAPVTVLTGPGTGTSSRKAVKQLERLVFEAIARNEHVFITIKKKSDMNVIQRAKAPTPKFFKVLRAAGMVLATAGGAVLASPVALPAGIAALGGYLAVGGGVLTAVSQVAVDDKGKRKNDR